MLPILFAQSVMRSADDSHESNNRHTTSPLFTEKDIYIPQENKCFYCYLVSSLLTHQFNQSNDTITSVSFFCIQHSMLKSFDNLLKKGSLKLYGRKIAYDFFIVENFDLTDKAMPPTRACVLKNTLKISLHFLTLADMTKTLKSQKAKNKLCVTLQLNAE